MSSSNEIVMQKKDATTPVTWSEHLRDYLTGMFDKSTSKLEEDVQAVQLKLEENDTTLQGVQTTVNTMQTSMQTLQASIDALRLTIDQRQQQNQQFDDAFEDGSVANNNQQIHGRRRAAPQQARGFAPLGRVGRVPLPDNDILGKPKFSIPSFLGSTDVEEYLTWELKIEGRWVAGGTRRNDNCCLNVE